MAEGEGERRKGGGVRLSREEVAAIKAAARHTFGADAIVRLFGSRLYDARRGGDIDLHVEVAPEVDAFAARCRFEDSLFARIEQQKVDIVIRKFDEPLRGIDMIAHRDGVRL